MTSPLQWRGCNEALVAFLDGASGSPVQAIFTTFDLEVDALLRHWLPGLRRRHAQMLLLVDRSRWQLNASHDDLEGVHLAPVALHTQGVFHAKVGLIRAGDRTLAIVGSGNLTRGGCGGNLELQLAADTTTLDGQHLVGGVVGFLRDLADSRHVAMPASAQRAIEDLLHGLNRSDQTVFSSLKRPLLDQLVQRTGPGKAQVTVMSPWHAGARTGQDSAVLTQLRIAYGAHIEVLTDGKGGYAPDLQVRTRIYRRPRRDPGTSADGSIDGAGEDRPARLHAKTYLIERGRQAWWFLGSANATTPGMLRSAAQRGNVEVLAELAIDQAVVAAWREHVGELFQDAKPQQYASKAAENGACSGVVLSGDLWEAKGQHRLRIHAISTRIRRARIASADGRATMDLAFHRGVACIDDPARLHRLLPDPPCRAKGVVTLVLFERVGSRRIPFPVAMPLVLPPDADQAAGDLLSEALRLVSGRWPIPKRSTKRPGVLDDPDEEQPPPVANDRDLDDLTVSDHLGTWDHLARQVAELARQLRSAPQSGWHERTSALIAALRRTDLQPRLIEEIISILSSAVEGT